MLKPVMFGEKIKRMPAPVQFGRVVRILADSPQDSFVMATAMRQFENSRGECATVMEFPFDPDVSYMLSGRDCIDATELIEDLNDATELPLDEFQDEYVGGPMQGELQGLLTDVMRPLHHRLAAKADVLDFRLESSDEKGGGA